MANRAYLYGINTQDTHKVKERQMIGLGEYNYSVPLLYKILCSGNVKKCRSTIFRGTKKAAILAKRDEGVAALESFFNELEKPELKMPIQETLKWLSEPHNIFEFLLLEPGEIFALDDLDSAENQLDALFKEIKALGGAGFKEYAKEYTDNDVMASWSNFLYYAPQGCVKPPKDKKAERHSFSVDELERYASQFEAFQCEVVSIHADGSEVDRLKGVLPELNKMPNLRELWCKGATLVPEIGQLKCITKLVLTSNKIDSVPVEWGELTQLEEIHLSGCGLSALPELIRAFKNLRILAASKNALTTLPAWISELGDLEELVLTDNQLKTLPSEITRLNKLKKINVAANGFENPYAELEMLCAMPALESITISGNASGDAKKNGVPDALWRKSDLTHLFLPKFYLPSIPDAVAHLQKLETLGLNACSLSEVSAQLWTINSLKLLMLIENPLTELGDGLGNLSNLEELNLTGCQLAALPDVFHSLKNLRNVQLARNAIESVPASLKALKDSNPRFTLNLHLNPVVKT